MTLIEKRDYYASQLAKAEADREKKINDQLASIKAELETKYSKDEINKLSDIVVAFDKVIAIESEMSNTQQKLDSVQRSGMTTIEFPSRS